MSNNIIVLDRALAHYGPETKEPRDLLRGFLVRMHNQIWLESSSQQAQSERPTEARGEVLFKKIQALSPQNDAQRSIKDLVLNLVQNVGQTRWLMFEQTGNSIPMPFLVILVFWITIIFISSGLFAPSNATVIATLFVCALSVSGAVFLILELDRPFHGLIQISSAPLQNALAHLGQ